MQLNRGTFSEFETQQVRDLAGHVTIDEIARRLQRSRGSVKRFAIKHDIQLTLRRPILTTPAATIGRLIARGRIRR